MEAPELERRLAAIVAADVEGYSRLMHSDEEATMATLSARRLMVDNLIIEHRGRIANTAGDSILAEFASVLDAVSCAIEIQKTMEQENEIGADRAMRFRIGINVGDVMVKDGDIFGDGVNVAARLEGLAEGGGICVSRGVRDHLRHRTNLVFEDLGEQLVKNIAHPIRAYRLRIGRCAEEIASEAPSSVNEAPLSVNEAPLSVDTELSADNEVTLEIALWESVKDGGPAELDSYLEHYPEGTFASLARTRQSVAEDKARPASIPEPEGAPNMLDLAFWDTIKESQLPEELAAYLERHPEGHFAALARVRLSQPAEATPPGPAAAQTGAAGDTIELAFWESIRDTADPRLIATYLEKYPEGEFAVIARARLQTSRSDHEKR